MSEPTNSTADLDPEGAAANGSQRPAIPVVSDAPAAEHGDGSGAESVAERPEVVDSVPGADGSGEEEGTISSPAKIIRVGSMVKQLLEEVRNTPMDDSAREHLASIYEQSIDELKASLSDDLAEELERLAPDFDGETVPSDASLRIAQAQLVGWLEGLFHGIQATLVAQQMAARQQLEGMRGQLAGPGQSPGQQQGMPPMMQGGTPTAGGQPGQGGPGERVSPNGYL